MLREARFEARLPSGVDLESCAIAVWDDACDLARPPDTGRSWLAGHQAESTSLMSAVLACESAGRLFTPVHVRTALVGSWLAGRTTLIPPGEESRLAFSIPGDGFSPPAVVKAFSLGAGEWQVQGAIPYAEARMNSISAVVIAVHTDGQSQLLLAPIAQPGVTIQRQIMFDPSRPGAAIDFGASAPAYARCLFQAEAADTCITALRSFARTLVAAEMLGIASLAMTLAVTYARRRVQFGKPIFEFQAISHSCSEMLCDIELVRSMLYGIGGRTADAGTPAAIDANKAKFLAGELCPKVVDRAVHVFGAEGLTWDRGLHLLTRRVEVLRALWGDPLECERELARALGL